MSIFKRFLRKINQFIKYLIYKKLKQRETRVPKAKWILFSTEMKREEKGGKKLKRDKK